MVNKRKSGILPTTAHARLEHAMENTSDYLEVIADLIRETGEARQVDIAKRIGVTKPTVNKKLAVLRREGYIDSKPYRSIFLLPAGAQLAEQSKKKHEQVLEFLLALGVPPPIAEKDAEGIEHHVSPETLELMQKALSILLRNRKKITGR